MRRRLSIWTALVCAPVFLLAGAANAQIYDQQNTVEGNGCFSVYTAYAKGQTFVPSLDHVDFVDLSLCYLGFGSGPPGQLTVWMHSGVFGPVLGVSQPVDVAGPDQVRTFGFPASIPLVPQSTHSFSFHQTGGTGNWGIRESNGNPYPRGGLYDNGFGGGGEVYNDAWFREGISAPVPARALTWGKVKTIYR